MKQKYINCFMDIAEVVSELSTAKKLRVGAIIVKDNRIISIGYNGMPSGWSNDCETSEYSHERGHYLKTKPEVIHAEVNAITKVAASNENCKGAVMFCTHTPCIECAKVIYQSGIEKVIYKNNYEADKGSGADFLIEGNVTLQKYKNKRSNDV